MNSGQTEIWDRTESRRVLELSGYIFAVTGDRLVTAGSDHVIRLWDIPGNLQAELGRHSDLVTDLEFSPDQRQLVSSSKDGSALVFDLAELGDPRTISHEEVYLLTTDAVGCFARFEFAWLPLEEAPIAVCACEQFARQCPGSVILIRLML
jgi:WD40 repeat protein